jgi:hypothetical protein
MTRILGLNILVITAIIRRWRWWLRWGLYFLVVVAGVVTIALTTDCRRGPRAILASTPRRQTMPPTREQEFDGPWKQALELAFELFLALFLPDLYDLIDWTREHDALEQELQKLMPESATGVRRVDKLFKAKRKETHDPRFFHVEAQAQPQPEEEFGRRMYTYSYRGRDLLGQPLIRIAILCDDQPEWHPKQYKEGEHGSEVTFTFRTVKVLQWAGRQAELEAGDNLFGLFVSAHLESQKTRDDPDTRAEGKIRLLSNLLKRERPDLERGKWYNVIDWILPLPPDRERQVFQKLKGEHPMTYISFAERYGREQGIEQGEVQGARKTLEAIMTAKFGAEGTALVQRLGQTADLARLNELSCAAALAISLDDVRALFENHNGNA